MSCTAWASRESLSPVLCVWICPFLRRRKVTEPGYVNCCCQEPTAEPSLFTGALSKDRKQIQRPDEGISKGKKQGKGKPGRRSHLVKLWKLVLGRAGCEIPQHIVSACSPSLQTSVKPLSLPAEKAGKTEACSLLPHKPSASFFLYVPQGFLIFPCTGHRPDLGIKQLIQGRWFPDRRAL